MRYKNAPIQEAVFDIQIDKLENTSLSELEGLHSLVLDKFPKKKKRLNFSGSVALEGEEFKSQEVKTHPQGFMLLTEDEKKLVQFRLDGFSFNVLRPYNSWVEHFKEAMVLWQLFDSKMKPHSITRISTRFINRIELPDPVENMRDYFTLGPPVLEHVPQTCSSFLLQIEIPYVENGCTVILTQTTVPEESKNFIPLILDIDVVKPISSKLSLEELGKNFQVLRTIKNQVFESCITDRTRKLFEK
jgi:uncharacterized protein (TIGR04255 family)